MRSSAFSHGSATTSSPSPSDYASVRIVIRARLDVLRQCPVGAREWRRALDVYEVLAHQGGLHHRRVKHPDLVIAAAAESAGLQLVHYDADFETIGAVTGQATRWLAPRGSL